jgi:hypothetical protein
MGRDAACGTQPVTSIRRVRPRYSRRGLPTREAVPRCRLFRRAVASSRPHPRMVGTDRSSECAGRQARPPLGPRRSWPLQARRTGRTVQDPTWPSPGVVIGRSCQRTGAIAVPSEHTEGHSGRAGDDLFWGQRGETVGLLLLLWVSFLRHRRACQVHPQLVLSGSNVARPDRRVALRADQVPAIVPRVHATDSTPLSWHTTRR